MNVVHSCVRSGSVLTGWCAQVDPFRYKRRRKRQKGNVLSFLLVSKCYVEEPTWPPLKPTPGGQGRQ